MRFRDAKEPVVSQQCQISRQTASVDKSKAFPPYTHVPGVTPHPISSPDGHARNDAPPTGLITDEQRLDDGVRLFNAGYYWESHETWEHLWIKLGRNSADALVVKGLIKLAACGVKCLEGNSTGAIRHATRASALLGDAVDSDLLQRINLSRVRAIAANSPPVLAKQSDGTPQPLPGFVIPVCPVDTAK